MHQLFLAHAATFCAVIAGSLLTYVLTLRTGARVCREVNARGNRHAGQVKTDGSKRELKLEKDKHGEEHSGNKSVIQSVLSSVSAAVHRAESVNTRSRTTRLSEAQHCHGLGLTNTSQSDRRPATETDLVIPNPRSR
ncbi:hypothetical protein BaRGS_00029884 [Batillaria attramentaria]|uniref:Secreted protein n=1 Tax=Batillaria attramentaria TaxID=370345 RepID=A0ABD0JWE5_9CAEN